MKSNGTSLKKNVVANGAGQGWRAIMSLAFVPVYVRHLGIEAYGLIGIYGILQAWLSLLDMGMKPALGREMARFRGGAHSAQSIRDLLRSVELIALAVATGVALFVWLASGWLASDWLKVGSLPVQVVARAFSVMGILTALRFVEDIYVSCLSGLELQVELNLVTSAMATARGAGAVGVLVWISPTIEAFFLWQGLVSVATVLLFAGITRRALPASPLPARFSGVALRGIWNFAAGMMAITLLSLLLTQTDKILLSRLLSLKAYGYYALAGVVTNGLFMIVAPITGAFYPRFTELATAGKEAASRSAYHQGSQLVSVAMGSAAIMLILFRESVLLLWAGDPVLVSQVAPITAVLAFGVLLNGLMWMPYQMMLAHGWTSLTIRANIVAVTFLVPSILWVVPRYGAVGAAWLYAALNACSIVFTVQIMHLRLLSGEKWRWYGQDVAAPLGAAAVVALLCRWLIPLHLGKIAESVALAATSGLVLFSAGLAAPAVRTQLIHWFDSRKRLIHAN